MPVHDRQYHGTLLYHGTYRIGCYQQVHHGQYHGTLVHHGMPGKGRTNISTSSEQVYMYTMGSTMGYCITVHMKEYSSAGTLWTIPWALLHHGMQRNGWTHSSVQVYHGQYYGTLVYRGTHDGME